jgi:hypothetical protein
MDATKGKLCNVERNPFTQIFRALDPVVEWRNVAARINFFIFSLAAASGSSGCEAGEKVHAFTPQGPRLGKSADKCGYVLLYKPLRAKEARSESLKR